MTVAFHHYSGMVLGLLLAKLLGYNMWIGGVIGFLIGGFSDSSSWVMWKLFPTKWDRWKLYNMCHPVPGGGQWDKYCKWIPFWGQHTWLWDSIVHPEQPKFLFPQFKEEWKYDVWVEIWPTHWNIQVTKWWGYYVLLEVSLWILYTALLIILV